MEKRKLLKFVKARDRELIGFAYLSSMVLITLLKQYSVCSNHFKNLSCQNVHQRKTQFQTQLIQNLSKLKYPQTFNVSIQNISTMKEIGNTNGEENKTKKKTILFVSPNLIYHQAVKSYFKQTHFNNWNSEMKKIKGNVHSLSNKKIKAKE